jgi:hypothetical protein
MCKPAFEVRAGRRTKFVVSLAMSCVLRDVPLVHGVKDTTLLGGGDSEDASGDQQKKPAQGGGRGHNMQNLAVLFPPGRTPRMRARVTGVTWARATSCIATRSVHHSTQRTTTENVLACR